MSASISHIIISEFVGNFRFCCRLFLASDFVEEIRGASAECRHTDWFSVDSHLENLLIFCLEVATPKHNARLKHSSHCLVVLVLASVGDQASPAGLWAHCIISKQVSK